MGHWPETNSQMNSQYLNSDMKYPTFDMITVIISRYKSGSSNFTSKWYVWCQYVTAVIIVRYVIWLFTQMSAQAAHIRRWLAYMYGNWV